MSCTVMTIKLMKPKDVQERGGRRDRTNKFVRG